MDTVFQAADILLPEKTIDMEKWSVIACDQFTSEIKYWNDLKEYVGDNKSVLNLVLPEISCIRGVNLHVDNRHVRRYSKSLPYFDCFRFGDRNCFVQKQEMTAPGQRLAVILDR